MINHLTSKRRDDRLSRASSNDCLVCLLVSFPRAFEAFALM